MDGPLPHLKWVKSLCRVRLFATPWTVAYQAPPSMEFSRQEYWSGLRFPSPGALSNPGIKPGSPAVQADALPSESLGKPHLKNTNKINVHTSSVSSTLWDFTIQEAGLSWMCARSWGALWDPGIGGSGARLFLGASDGRVFEIYCLEMVLLFVKVGRCLLTRGVAGALTV